MISPRYRISLVAAAFFLGSTLAGQAATAYANLGTSLATFDTATPGTSTNMSYHGAAGLLRSITYSPVNNTYYAIDYSSRLLTLDPKTGLTTVVGALPENVIGVPLLEVNASTGSISLYNAAGANWSIDPTSLEITKHTPFSLAPGDVNFGQDFSLWGMVYQNSAVAGSTVAYFIDTLQDTLLMTTDVAGGVMTTVGSLGVDTSGLMGMDLVPDGEGGFTIYAMLTDITVQKNLLYTIDPDTGAASLIGTMNRSSLNSLIVVPEPSTLGLLGMAFLGFFIRRR